MKETQPDTDKTKLQPAENPPVTPDPGQPPRKPAPEFGGPSGPEPTRYGDWERNGRVSDF